MSQSSFSIGESYTKTSYRREEERKFFADDLDKDAHNSATPPTDPRYRETA